jgi:hypothetical protein
MAGRTIRKICGSHFARQPRKHCGGNLPPEANSGRICAPRLQQTGEVDYADVIIVVLAAWLATERLHSLIERDKANLDSFGSAVTASALFPICPFMYRIQAQTVLCQSVRSPAALAAPAP